MKTARWLVPMLAVVVASACSFDASAPSGVVACSAQEPSCPTGLVCRVALGRCLAAADGDGAAPGVVSSLLPDRPLGRGAALRVAFEVSEPLGLPPPVLLTQSGRTVALQQVEQTGLQYVFARRLDADDIEGPASLSTELTDGVGNSSGLVPLGSVLCDFTPPQVASLTFTAPRPSNDAGALAVRAADPVAARLAFSEPVSPGFAVRGVSAACPTVTFTTASASGSLVDVTVAAPAGVAGCDYQLDVSDVADLAGNVRPGGPLAARYAVDETPPRLTGLDGGPTLDVLRASDGGLVPTARFSRAPGFDEAWVGFRVDPTAVSFAARHDTQVLAGCGLGQACVRSADGWWRCLCRRPVALDDEERGHLFSVLAVDEAGNPASAAAPLELDFTAPSVLPGSLALEVRPPVGSLRPTVERLTVGGRLRVSFALDEPSSADLAVAPAAVGFRLISRTATSFSFEGSVDAGALQGPQQLTILVQDDVGNEARWAQPDVVWVDTLAPLPPAVRVDGGVLYRRVPWGGLDAGVRYEVVGAAGAAEPGTTLVVTDARGSELGRAAVSDAGAFFAPLVQADRSEVLVRSVDSAGNASAAVDVKDVEWVASLEGLSLADPSRNPHALEVRAAFSHQLDSPLGRPAVPPVSARTPSRWEREELVPEQLGGQLVFDATRGRLVHFGGLLAGGGSEVAEFDGQQWSVVRPPGPAPSSRRAHGMAFDPARGTFLVHGGLPDGISHETWEYDGHGWANRTTADGGPGARSRPAMAFDPIRRRVLLHGGVGLDFQERPDTWEWDGYAWARRWAADAGLGPQGSSGAMVFDEAQGHALLLVPDMAGNTMQLWAWDGAAWRRLAAAAAPRWRNFFGWAYDPVRRVSWLYGGSRSSSEPLLGDLWQWDGAAWTERTPAISPPGRAEPLLSFDRARGVLVLVSGRGNGPALALRDQWEFDGTRWLERTGGSARPGSFALTATHDDRRGVNVFVGAPLLPNTQLQVWESAGPAWHDLSDAGLPKSMDARVLPGLVFDSVRGQTLLFGGARVPMSPTSALYVADGGAWSLWAPVGMVPAPRYEPAFAFDSARGRAVLFGGSTGSAVNFADTWEWTGGGWELRADAGPPADPGRALAYDAARRRSVLFGGSSSDTWLWDGAAWSRAGDGGVAPAPRGGHAMAFDPVRQRTVLFGGATSSGPSDEVWEWDGAAWSQASADSAGGPAARMGASMTFDTRRGKVLLISGNAVGTRDNTPWQWGRTFGERPSVVLRFRTAFLGEPAARVQALALRVDASASAQALDGGVPAAVSLGVYDVSQGFAPVAVTPVPGGWLSWTSTDSRAIERVWSAPRAELAVAVSPAVVDTRSSAAQIDVRRAELTVRYRRP